MESKTPGVITRLTEKGFGFIKVDGHEKSIFFHAQQIRNTDFDLLHEGDKVLINEITESEKGLSANGVYVQE